MKEGNELTTEKNDKEKKKEKDKEREKRNKEEERGKPFRERAVLNVHSLMS